MDAIDWEPRKGGNAASGSPSGVAPTGGVVSPSAAEPSDGPQSQDGASPAAGATVQQSFAQIDSEHDPDDPNDSFQRTKLAEQQLEQDDLDAAARVVDELTEQLASEIGQIKTLTAVMRARQADRSQQTEQTGTHGPLLRVAEQQFVQMQQHLAAEAQARTEAMTPVRPDALAREQQQQQQYTGPGPQDSVSRAQSPVPDNEVHYVFLPDGTRLTLYNNMLFDELGNDVPWETLGPGAGPHLLVQVGGPPAEGEEGATEGGDEAVDDDEEENKQGQGREGARADEIRVQGGGAGEGDPARGSAVHPPMPRPQPQQRQDGDDATSQYDSDTDVVGQRRAGGGTGTGTGPGAKAVTRARPAALQSPFANTAAAAAAAAAADPSVADREQDQAGSGGVLESKTSDEDEGADADADASKAKGKGSQPSSAAAASPSPSSSFQRMRLARRPTEVRMQFTALQDSTMSLHRQIQEENRKIAQAAGTEHEQDQQGPSVGGSPCSASSRQAALEAGGRAVQGGGVRAVDGTGRERGTAEGLGAGNTGSRRHRRRRRAANVSSMRPSKILSTAVRAMRTAMRSGSGQAVSGLVVPPMHAPHEGDGSRPAHASGSGSVSPGHKGQGIDRKQAELERLQQHRAMLEVGHVREQQQQQQQQGTRGGSGGGVPPHRRGSRSREQQGPGASFAFVDVEGEGEGEVGVEEEESGMDTDLGLMEGDGEGLEGEGGDMHVDQFRMVSEEEEDEEEGGQVGRHGYHHRPRPPGAGRGRAPGSSMDFSSGSDLGMGGVAMPDGTRGDVPPEQHGAEAALVGIGMKGDRARRQQPGQGRGWSRGQGRGHGMQGQEFPGHASVMSGSRMTGEGEASTISGSASMVSGAGGRGGTAMGRDEEEEEDEDDEGFKHFGAGKDGAGEGTGEGHEEGEDGRGDHQRVAREGQLWKADRHGAKWRKRWACVCPEKLYYFSSDTQAREAKAEGNMTLYKAGIDLHMCTVVIQRKQPRDAPPKGTYPFTLQCGGRKFWFAATSADERRVWVTMLCEITQESPEVVLEGFE